MGAEGDAPPVAGTNHVSFGKSQLRLECTLEEQMADIENSNKLWDTRDRNKLKAGIIVGYSLASLTLITFVFAMLAVPISGANAPNGGIPYPYLDTLQQYPRDYIWQYIGMVVIILYLAHYAFIEKYINASTKISTRIGLLLAIISAGILLVDYYLQVTIIVPSLRANEHEGIALVTQYNPHGTFIALEELGYILMLLSFVCLVPIYIRKAYGARSLAIINTAGAVVVMLDFIALSIKYGLDRKDRFEIVILSVCWLLLILNGLLIARRIRKDVSV